MKGLSKTKQKKKKKRTDTDNNMVITRGKVEVGEVGNSKGVINSDRRFDFRW